MKDWTETNKLLAPYDLELKGTIDDKELFTLITLLKVYFKHPVTEVERKD